MSRGNSGLRALDTGSPAPPGRAREGEIAYSEGYPIFRPRIRRVRFWGSPRRAPAEAPTYCTTYINQGLPLTDLALDIARLISIDPPKPPRISPLGLICQGANRGSGPLTPLAGPPGGGWASCALLRFEGYPIFRPRIRSFRAICKPRAQRLAPRRAAAWRLPDLYRSARTLCCQGLFGGSNPTLFLTPGT